MILCTSDSKELVSGDDFPYHLLSRMLLLHILQLRVDETDKLLHLLVEQNLQVFPG